MSLQHAILGLLTYRSMSGYDLKLLVDQSVNYFWSAHQSQIYRELGVLERQEWVSSQVEPQEGRPDRKVYSITTVGKQELQRWLERFPDHLKYTVRDEFSLRLFFGAHLEPDEIAFQLRRFIRDTKRQLEAYSAAQAVIAEHTTSDELREEAPFWRMTLRRGEALAESDLRWAEQCLAELEGFGRRAGERDTRKRGR